MSDVKKKIQIILTTLIESFLKLSPQELALGIIGSLITFRISKYLINQAKVYSFNKSIIQKSKEFIKNRNDRLDKFYEENSSKYSKETQEEIQKSSLTALRNFLIEGKYKSVDLVTVFLMRNSELKELNNLADVNIEESLSIARKSDEILEELKNSGKLDLLESKYPLLGIPISIKDSLGLNNFRSTLGYGVGLDFPNNTYDSSTVKILKDNGAVPLIKSNIPLGLYAMESTNSVFGTAQNPFNRKRVVGGSSGGEGGLVSSFCSPCGIGSDIGGSIRMPAAFCGLYAFKPTPQRVSLIGEKEIDFKDSSLGFNLLRVSHGPLARDFNDVLKISRILLGSYKNDSYVFNKKFDEAEFNEMKNKKKLKIAYFDEIELCKLTPPQRDVLHESLNALKNNNRGIEVTVERFVPKQLTEFVILFYKLMSCSQTFETIIETSKGEYQPKCYKNLNLLIQLPDFMVKLYSKICKLFGNRREHTFVNFIEPNMGLKDYFKNCRRLSELKYEIIHEFQSNGYDMLISPTSAFPTPRHFDSNDLCFFVYYTMIHNFLDLPAGIIPIRKCGKITTPYEDKFNDKYTRLIKENLVDAENLPLCIQVATLSNQDERCLAAMDLVSGILKEQKVIQDIYTYDVKKILNN